MEEEEEEVAEKWVIENIYCGGIFLLTMEINTIFVLIRYNEIIKAVGSLLS